MNNQIAITLVVLIIAIFALDYFWLHMNLPVLTGKMFDSLVDYVSFWN